MTGQSRKEMMEMRYLEFVKTYIDAYAVAKERERKRKQQANQ